MKRQGSREGGGREMTYHCKVIGGGGLIVTRTVDLSRVGRVKEGQQMTTQSKLDTYLWWRKRGMVSFK